jgi:hypothetical protein
VPSVSALLPTALPAKYVIVEGNYSNSSLKLISYEIIRMVLQVTDLKIPVMVRVRVRFKVRIGVRVRVGIGLG